MFFNPLFLIGRQISTGPRPEEVTVKDTYPLPLIEECLDSLAINQWFFETGRKCRLLANQDQA